MECFKIGRRQVGIALSYDQRSSPYVSSSAETPSLSPGWYRSSSSLPWWPTGDLFAPLGLGSSMAAGALAQIGYIHRCAFEQDEKEEEDKESAAA